MQAHRRGCSVVLAGKKQSLNTVFPGDKGRGYLVSVQSRVNVNVKASINHHSTGLKRGGSGKQTVGPSTLGVDGLVILSPEHPAPILYNSDIIKEAIIIFTGLTSAD